MSSASRRSSASRSPSPIAAESNRRVLAVSRARSRMKLRPHTAGATDAASVRTDTAPTIALNAVALAALRSSLPQRSRPTRATVERCQRRAAPTPSTAATNFSAVEPQRALHGPLDGLLPFPGCQTRAALARGVRHLRPSQLRPSRSVPVNQYLDWAKALIEQLLA